MLNTELQNDINTEIDKASQEVKSFLTDKYFRDNMDLIIKVNKLTSDQGESVELETILNMLGLSDRASIDEAIKSECYIEKAEVVTQVTKDLKDYIFAKVPVVAAAIPLIMSSVDGLENNLEVVTQVQKDLKVNTNNVSDLRSDIISSTTDSITPVVEIRKDLRSEIEEGYDKNLLTTSTIAYYDDKRTGKDMPVVDSLTKQNTETELVKPSMVNVPTITNANVMPDAYRELPATEDNIIPRDVDMLMQNGGGDGIIRGV